MIVRNVSLEVDGLRLAGQLYLPRQSGPSSYPTVCVCHGVPAGTAAPGDRGYQLLAERICREELGAFIFNFRGTGASEGNLDLLGWTRDLRAAIDYLYSVPEVDKTRLAVLGFSGGAAVSISVASGDRRISGVAACACPAEFGGVLDPLFLISHFRSIGVIRDEGFPHSVEEWGNGFRRVRPIEHIAGIAPRPLLLVHGNRDEVVNVSHAYRLYAKAGEPKQMVIVDGAGHRLRQDERAVGIAIDWLKSQSRG